jgi:SAM-dependent methyltransferase
MNRFSDRVENYVKYRPDYPRELLAFLRDRFGLGARKRVADVGSGTGIFSAQLLELGAVVVAVEPNAEMRAAAERALAARPGFASVAAAAEDTGLPPGSVDLVTAAQAFHWFEAARARSEWKRILRPEGQALLIWNNRKLEGSPFLEEYEDLLLRHGVDYAVVRHQNLEERGDIGAFFAPHKPELFSCAHEQRFDFEGLAGRVLSSSYAPAPGHPKHEPMMTALRALFERHERGGQVAFEYVTQAFFGPL